MGLFSKPRGRACPVHGVATSACGTQCQPQIDHIHGYSRPEPEPDTRESGPDPSNGWW